MKGYCVKDGKRDAEEFLRLFLDALDEELVESYAYISTRKPPLLETRGGSISGELD